MSGTTGETPAEPGTGTGAETGTVPVGEVKTLPAPAPPEPLPPPPPPPSRPRRPVWPLVLALVFAIGFLLLAAGEGYLWHDAQKHRADATELAVLKAQLDDLRAAQAQAAPAPDSATVQAGLAQKYISLAAQVAAVQAQAASDHGALSMIQANATDLGKLTQRMELLNALGTARLALEAGQPVGQIPNAAPALARFASTAPPTEAQLRESFPQAARAAKEASIAGNGKSGFWAGVKLRLESMITISNGQRVIFGPPAAADLRAAGLALDNGDLAGAVARLQNLGPGAKAAMQGWLDQAQALLAARAALVSMAQGNGPQSNGTQDH